MWPLLLLLPSVFCYNYLVVVPAFGHSHVTYLASISNALTLGGHDVTVFIPLLDPAVVNTSSLFLSKKIIYKTADPRVVQLFTGSQKTFHKDMWTMNPNMTAVLQMSNRLSEIFSYACENIFSDESLLKELQSQTFDVGIAEPFFICGLALFEAIGLNTTIGATSTVQQHAVSRHIGEILDPSLVPALGSELGDAMDLFGRIRNALTTAAGVFFLERSFAAEISTIRQKLGNDFKDYPELLSQMSYWFTNSNPYLDYSRPTIPKTIEIGGLPLNLPDSPLDRYWDVVLSLRPEVVLISFGTVAKSRDMPDDWKETIMSVVAAFPNTTFIWKYEEELECRYPNLYTMAWLPQTALLSDPRISLFISHGGLASTTEIAYSGKPSIMVPLLFDQPRNAEMLARHGGALVISKNDVTKSDVLQNAINQVLSETTYKENAQRLAELLANQPVSPEHLVLKHAEFAAKFGRLPQLEPPSRHLHFWQHYLWDLVAVFCASLLLLISFVVLIVRVFVRLRNFRIGLRVVATKPKTD